MNAARHDLPAGAFAPRSIIFVHGVGAHPALFRPMRRHLERCHGARTHALRTRAHRVEDIAGELRELVRVVRGESGHKIDLVGHSMGGLVARWMLQELEGASSVANLITLATPHHGTRTAYLSRTPRARALRPGSLLISRLNATPIEGLPVRVVSIYGDLDMMVVPKQSAWLRGGENVLLKRLSHNGYFVSPRVWRLVASLLYDPSERARGVRAV